MSTMNLFPNVISRSERGYDRLPEQLPPGPIAADFETTGLDRRAGARPFGLAIANATEEWFVRWDDRTIEWCLDQLAERDLLFAEAKFDIGMAMADGVSFEDMGIKPHDVQHPAALLDDRRRKFGLDILAKDRLGRSKLELPGPPHELPVALVAPYARQDARLTYDLWQSYQPDIEQEGMEKVLELEDSLIYCTLSMEEAGTPLDIPKLEKWTRQVEQARVERLFEIHRRTGLRINPTSGPDLSKLFRYLQIPHTGHTTDGGSESFTEPILEEYVESFPEIKLALEARQLASFLSKYLVKYREAVDSKGILRYRLHQLRADEGGTITGRYASSKVNIQQVMKPDKQAQVLAQWILRELMIPDKGSYGMLDSDMSQVEYRLFAHYADVPRPHSGRLAEAYRKNPKTDFHELVMGWTGLIRSLAKNVNFAKLYGAQEDKIALMCGVSVEDAEDLVAKYDKEFPEAGRLLKYCERLAKRRGYIKTFMGRRRYYNEGDRFYSALNTVLQGTAAELMKLKLRRLYQERRTTGYMVRATVHDEHYGDMGKKNTKKLVDEVHAVQELPLKVPILWSTGTGKNWREAMK